jgi:hypothetical protein
MPEAVSGRWLTMDAGDVDGDGWTDLVLGNFYMGPNRQPSKVDWSKSPPVLVLNNKGNLQPGKKLFFRIGHDQNQPGFQ